jgi:Protein of unknown function (DUF3768)
VSSEAIAHLNDQLRANIFTYQSARSSARWNRVVLTPGIAALAEEAKLRPVLEAVKDFNDFSQDNDPYCEHDYGRVEAESLKLNEAVMWKIDYYDRALESLSENPADALQTRRVLTVMFASER